MKALHTYTTIARQPKQNARPGVDGTLDVKEKRKKMKYCLEIVPVRVVVRFSHPRIRIRSNNALNATALRPPTIPSTSSAYLRDTPWSVHLHAFRHDRQEPYMSDT